MSFTRSNYLCALVALLALAVASCRTSAPSPDANGVYKDKAWTEFFRRENGWVAGDGALSIALSDGRVIWLFGDSHVNDYDPKSRTVPCLFQVRNAAMVHDLKNLDHAGTRLLNELPNHNAFRHPDGGTNWFWPVNGFEDHGSVFVYLVALKPRGVPGMWDFTGTGHYWAKMQMPDLTEISYLPLPDSNGIDFGCGFIRDGDSGYTLSFGQKGNGKDTSIYLARFKTAEPDRNWTYWNGKEWIDNATNAVAISTCPTVSISACKLKNKFVLTSSALSIACDTGREIFVSTSDTPTGAFTPVKKIYTLDDTWKGHYPFFYIPVCHPEVINERNEVLVTYSINGYDPCVPTCVKGRMNPDHYRPKAIRVPLKFIDSGL